MARSKCVRVLGYTNPKQFPDQPTGYLRFQGTFDPRSGKWNESSARKIKSAEFVALVTAYDENFTTRMIVATDPAKVREEFIGSIFSSEEEKANALDKMMNEVYEAVRSVLSPDHFVRVKEEQEAWLKTRDAAHSVADKSRLTESRIKALQNLLW